MLGSTFSILVGLSGGLTKIKFVRILYILNSQIWYENFSELELETILVWEPQFSITKTPNQYDSNPKDWIGQGLP